MQIKRQEKIDEGSKYGDDNNWDRRDANSADTDFKMDTNEEIEKIKIEVKKDKNINISKFHYFNKEH